VGFSGKRGKRRIPSVVAPFCLIQLAHNAAIAATLKDLLLRIYIASIASFDSVLSVSLSTSQVKVRSTIGWQIVMHAVGTSLLSSSSASTGPIMIVEKNCETSNKETHSDNIARKCRRRLQRLVIYEDTRAGYED